MSGLFGGGPSMPPIQQPPKAPDPIVMPQADQEAQKREQTKKNAQLRARSTTRASTILGDGETLG